MADLRNKAWVAALIDIKLSGQDINLQDEDIISPELINTHIVDSLEFYESSKKFDKALLNQFKEDFEGWTVNLFKIANKNIRRELKDRLKNSGVYVDGRGQVSDQLFQLLKCDECPEWPRDELELHLEKGNDFRSRRHNPNFDGQQVIIMQTRQSNTPQPASVPKLEPLAENVTTLNSESYPQQACPPIFNQPSQPSDSSQLRNNFSQLHTRISIAKVLMDLGKLYGDTNKKFGGNHYDVLDAKLRIFYDMCDKVGVTPDLYGTAYSTMLKEKAQDFYYQHLARQNLSFDEMVNKTRSYFHTPENYQAYLLEWRSTMLKSTIEAHPEKNMSECLEMVIDKLQKVHQGLVHNYNDNHSLPGQLISACQGVEACSIVLVRPASNFEGVASDLRSAVGMWMRTHTSSTRTFNSMAIDENIDENSQYYVDRRYMDNARPRGRGGSNSGSFPRGGFKTSHNDRQHKKCFVCGKPKCWSTRHPPEERKQRRGEWRSYAQDVGLNQDLETFLVNYEGIDIEQYLDNSADSKDFHAWLASTSNKSDDNQFDQFHTACGNINGHITTKLLNNQCVMHALTGIDPYDGKADGPSHLFHFQSRYDSEVFQGIMPDTGAAGISTAGKNQFKALQKKIPDIRLDTTTAGQYSVRFGDNPDTQSLGTVDVKTPFGVICFAVMPSNTPFLLCLSDMDRHGIYLNNVENVMVHNDKKYPIVRKWGHPWLLLEDLESSIVWCHMTEAELRQLHRRFGHPAAERLYKVLQRAGYEDLKLEAVAKITKYCHQCQMHGGTPGRFRFTLHDDVEFNYCVVIDVMYINKRPVLHAVDESTAFQAARFLTNVTAKSTWDTLRAMWIDMYVGPPDVIVTDAGKNLTAVEFRANAQSMAIKVEEIPVESHNSIGKIERYHHTLKRAYEVISEDIGTAVTPEDTLQMAVKAVNDTAGPHGLVPTLLVFGTYPRLMESSPPSPSITIRANAIRKAMDKIRKLKATRQVADGLSMRNGPSIIDTIQLPLQSEVKVWRENIGWTGPHILLSRSGDDVTCTVDVNGKVTNFRTVSVKPYYRDETTAIQDDNKSVDSPTGDDEEYRPIIQEQPQRRRGRPKGSKNIPKPLAVVNITDTIWMTEKEKLDTALAIKLRQEGKITTPGRPFEESDRLEVETLIGRGVFRFEKLDPQKHGEVRIFKSRMVREIKGKATEVPYEKSRLVIQGYNDDEKHMVLTQSPTIQRASQRIIMALAPSLLMRGMHLWLRDITQAYVQSHTSLQRTVLAHLPYQIRDNYPKNTIMVVVKPLYGIAEAGAHWWATYFKHHCERLRMETSTYDPCLLITTKCSGYFGVVGMQTDDTLGISDAEFAAQENEELQKAKFLAKEKQILNSKSPLLFNGCILSMQADGVLFLRQKNQAERLKLVGNNLEYIEQRARGAYLATICQPEASFDLSSAAQHKQPSKEDVARLNKRIKWQISNVGRGLAYIPLDVSSLRLFVFVDGSFANNNDMSSQIGFVIVLANEEAENESFTIRGNILHWSSTKCKRITRSVLASEIYAMANGVDMAISINNTINKILVQLGEPEILLVVCTDSFSLYECLVKLGTTKEKRLMIDIMAVRQAYEQHEVGDIRWINGADNPADAMTKITPNRALETLINDNKLTMRVQGWVKRSLETEEV